MEYLSEEKQYEKTLNSSEVTLIKDIELREIRCRYWEKFHQAFLDEKHIPDWELESAINAIKNEELAEINAYRQKKELPILTW